MRLLRVRLEIKGKVSVTFSSFQLPFSFLKQPSRLLNRLILVALVALLLYYYVKPASPRMWPLAKSFFITYHNPVFIQEKQLTGDGCYDLSDLEPVQDSSLSCSVQSKNQDSDLLIAPKPSKNARKDRA